MSEVIWEGADVLREHLVPVGELEEHPDNLDKNSVPEIMNSLKRWGQTRPVLMQDGLLVAGHHVRKAAINLGWTHVAAIHNEFANAGELRDYLVADNTIQENATYEDESAHVQMLLSVGDRTGTGITEDFVEDTLAKAGNIYVEVDHDWEGTGETEDDAAARAAALAAYEPHREVPLSLTVEEFEDFGRYVRAIQGERGFTRMAEAVLYALELAAVGTANTSIEPSGGTSQDERAPTEEVTSPHRVKAVFGDFVIGDDDAAYTCHLECTCGWERYAVHGEEAEKMTNEHLGAVLV
jgi:hypothetical protein